MPATWMPPARGHRSRRDTAVRLLVACLRADERDDPARLRQLLRSSTREDVVEAARYHGLAGLLYLRLRDLEGASPDLLDDLRERYEAAVRHHMRILWELGRVAPVLDGTGARWALVKGPCLVELVYREPGQRSYGDIDVVVEPGRFPDVLRALQEHGSRLLDRNWRILRRERRGELHLELPEGSLLDLHWHLVNMYRGGLRVDTSDALGRTARATLGSAAVPILDPTDGVIHLALHGTLSGGDRLIWMEDLARTVCERPPDWDEVIRRCAEWHAERPVGFMLARSATVLAAAIPQRVIDRLLGRPYRIAMSLADRFSPWQRAGGRVSSGSLLLARSMGYGPLGAAWWLARRSVAAVDPREPEASSSFTPRGSQRDLDSYLRGVVAYGEQEQTP